MVKELEVPPSAGTSPTGSCVWEGLCANPSPRPRPQWRRCCATSSRSASTAPRKRWDEMSRAARHLPEPADRRWSLEEAARVLRPGGLLLATGISRFAALLDLLVRLDHLHEPGVFDRVEEAVRTGVFRPQGAAIFTTAFFHLSTQLRDEVEGADFERAEIFSI